MDANLHTFKAQPVTKGYTQSRVIDYEDNFSQVEMIKSIRILLSIATFCDYKICKIDVKTSFLNEKQTYDLYMAQPDGFVHSKYPNRVCKLGRSIYRLKQASHRWNIYCNGKIKEFGFLRNEDEKCVYVRYGWRVVVFLIL